MLYRETREALWRIADFALSTTLFATRSKRWALFSNTDGGRLASVIVVDIKPAGLFGPDPITDLVPLFREQTIATPRRV